VYPDNPYEERRPGIFQTWGEALLYVSIFILLEALLTFIVVGILTVGSGN